ncbi:MAG TPA: N-acetylglucosamine-6-phosphate deacetylase [Acidimicrobiia bacterium]|nr:N-acetylglucosamine-6-phosphate deacetylase [Acidimicrobiia bacterium]
MPTIRNGRLIDRDVADLHFFEGSIVEEAADSEVIDVSGQVVIPGLIDIQINGGFGYDFTQDPTTIWAVGERLPELGVTAFLPTVVTSPDEVTDLAIDVVANGRPAGYIGAEVLGLHLEGPWIAPEMHGAHNPAHIVDPDLGVAAKWADSGVVRIVTLAPERPGATEVGTLLDGYGIVVSVGHTNADHATAASALGSYASLATHLFNQMTPLGHREPGVVGAVLESAHPAIMIVDGHHLAETTVDLAWRILGPERTVLVTDAMAALGLGHGTYPLGDGPITVGDDGPRTADGRLAGSVVTLPRAIQNLVAATGIPRHLAIPAATSNPARILRLEDRGSLDPGSRADIVLLDAAGEVTDTYSNGIRHSR